MLLPICTPPVKVIRSASALPIISSAISLGSPVITDSIGGGNPASYRTSARISAASGVFSVGFTTMRVLVATAGAAVWFAGVGGGVDGVVAAIAYSRGA